MSFLCAILLPAVVNCGQTGYCDIEKGPGKIGGRDRESPQVRSAENVLYTMLQQNGVIRLPKLNYELYAKRVQGRQLLDVEFRRKDPKTQKYDVIARAHEAELHVHMKSRQVLVDMRNCWISSSDPDIVTGFVEAKVWPIDLP